MAEVPSWRVVEGWFLRECRHGGPLDGSLHDLYVLDASPHDWSCWLRPLAGSTDWRTRFSRAGEPARLPSSFDEAGEAGCLRIDPDGLELRCLFFDPGEIELSVETDRLSGEPAYERLLAFMRWLAGRVGKPVILVPENERGHVVVAVDPPTCRSP